MWWLTNLCLPVMFLVIGATCVWAVYMSVVSWGGVYLVASAYGAFVLLLLGFSMLYTRSRIKRREGR